MEYHLMIAADIEAAATLIASNYTPEDLDAARKELESMFSNAAIRPVYWVAEKEGEILGVAGYAQSWIDYGIYELFWVNVAKPHQKQGIGRELVSRIIAEIRKNAEAKLIELSATAANIPYYQEHFGFSVVSAIGTEGPSLMCLSL